jgi:hypothetical protein
MLVSEVNKSKSVIASTRTSKIKNKSKTKFTSTSNNEMDSI